jgi:2-isopropylmalate synthase
MGDSDPQNEAVVKVTYGQTEGHEAGDGVGPIDALNLALLKAIAKQFPSIAEIKLYDYHIDLEKKEENRSPGGMVHCTVKFYYGTERWVSTASDKNQNTAGWKAILDAYILVAMQGQ